MRTRQIKTTILIFLFAAAFAFVESSVVVYLRALYYPGGFFFPLRIMPAHILQVELLRETATIIMLGVVGILAGNSRWNRFGFFMIAFGVWDIFYYIWLKVLINWPVSFGDWDILFLIPLPWISPVVVPVLISLIMIVAGLLIQWKELGGMQLQPAGSVWSTAIIGTIIILYTFLLDTGATLHSQLPLPYRYDLFMIGYFFYILSLFVLTYQKNKD